MDLILRDRQARQALEKSTTFLKNLASQTNTLRLSRSMLIVIHYYGANVVSVFFRSDSIRIKISAKAMLQMFYAQFQSESIPCRYEHDDSHSTYDRMFIGADVPFAQKAFQSIILIMKTVRRENRI